MVKHGITQECCLPVITIIWSLSPNKEKLSFCLSLLWQESLTNLKASVLTKKRKVFLLLGDCCIFPFFY